MTTKIEAITCLFSLFLIKPESVIRFPIRFVEGITSYGETKREARRRREGQNGGKGNTNHLIYTI